MAQSFTKIGETYFRKSDTGELYAVSDRDTLNALKVGSIPYNSVENTRGLTFANTADVSTTKPVVATSGSSAPAGGIDIAALVKEKLASSLMSYKGVTNPADLEVRRQELLRKQLLSSPYSEEGEKSLTGSQKLTLLRNKGKEFEPEIKSLEEQIVQRDKETTAGKRDTSLTEINGHRMLVDNQTGEIIKDLGITRSESGSTGLSTSVLTKVQTIAGQFDGEQAVKSYQLTAEAIDAVRNAGNTPTDDIQRVYAFAKVMDPNSVVREGEYKTVQDYSQAVLQAAGLKAARVFTNTGFLTPEARKFMLSTLENRFKSSEKAYKNIHSEYGRRIDKITGDSDGIDYITDYSKPFESSAPKSKTVSKGTMSDKEFIEAALNANNVPYANAVAHAPKGQIPVIDNATGQIGSIPPNEFDKSKYTRL